MKLPLTNAPAFLILDASREFVAFNQFAYPSLLAGSVLNRATQNPIIAPTLSSAQPVWSVNGAQGPYSWQNNPSMQVVGTPGGPALGFTGAQYLEVDAIASQFSGTETPITVVSVVSCSSYSSGTANTVWSVGNSGTATPTFALQYQSSEYKLIEVSSGGTTDAYSAGADGNLHVITAIRSSSALTLRVDGVQVATLAIGTPAAQTYNNFCVGAATSDGTRSAFLNGSISFMAVYGGVADIDEVEAFLLLDAGIQRTNVFSS